MAVAFTAPPATDTAHAFVPAVAPERLLYALSALFWLIMIVVAVQDRPHSPSTLWWEPLLWEASSAIGATTWMLLQRRTKQRYSQYLDQPLRRMPLLIVSFIACVCAMRHGVYALAGEAYAALPIACHSIGTSLPTCST